MRCEETPLERMMLGLQCKDVIGAFFAGVEEKDRLSGASSVL